MTNPGSVPSLLVQNIGPGHLWIFCSGPMCCYKMIIRYTRISLHEGKTQERNNASPISAWGEPSIFVTGFQNKIVVLLYFLGSVEWCPWKHFQYYWHLVTGTHHCIAIETTRTAWAVLTWLRVPKKWIHSRWSPSLCNSLSTVDAKWLQYYWIAGIWADRSRQNQVQWNTSAVELSANFYVYFVRLLEMCRCNSTKFSVWHIYI